METRVMENSELLIRGDFSLHVSVESDSDAEKFRRLLDSYNLVNDVHIPTHLTGHPLDLLLTKVSTQLHVDRVESTGGISDNFVVIVDLKLPKPKLSQAC